jgi:hypothetical protein
MGELTIIDFKCKRLNKSMTARRCIRNQIEAEEIFGMEEPSKETCHLCPEGMHLRNKGRVEDMRKRGICSNCKRPDMTLFTGDLCGSCQTVKYKAVPGKSNIPRITTKSIVPFDDTIPQKTEGTEDDIIPQKSAIKNKTRIGKSKSEIHLNIFSKRDEEIVNTIKAIAVKERRSLSAQVLCLLEKVIGERHERNPD